MDKREEKFLNLPQNEDCQELVRLLALDDDEIDTLFKVNKNLRDIYFSNEKCQTIMTQVEEPETEPSEEDTLHNININTM